MHDALSLEISPMPPSASQPDHAPRNGKWHPQCVPRGPTCQLPGDAKVADFDRALCGQQHVGRLDVPVHPVLTMKIHERLEHLPEHVRVLWLLQRLLIQLQRTQVALEN